MRWRAALIVAAAFVAGMAAPSGLRAEMTSAEARRQAAAALSDRAAGGDPAAIQALVPLLHAPDSNVRSHAESGLARAGGQAVPALQTELRRATDDEARARVARVIGRIGLAARPAQADMQRALEDPDSQLAGMAAYALGAMRARDALPDLVRAYAHSRAIPTQRHISRALRQIGSDQALRESKQALVTELQGELGAGARGPASDTLAYVERLYHASRGDGAYELPTPEELRPLVPALVRAAELPDAERSLSAIRALGLARQQPASVVETLERLLRDPRTRGEALSALRALDGAAARAAVARHEAAMALEARIHSEFSLLDHQGRMRLLPFRVSGSAADGLRMEARFLYWGRSPQRPERVVVSLESTSAESRLEKISQMTWLADERRIPMTNLERSWSRGATGGVIESISGTLALEDFVGLARAESVRGRLGGVEFELAPPDHAALRLLADRIPSAPAAAPR